MTVLFILVLSFSLPGLLMMNRYTFPYFYTFIAISGSICFILTYWAFCVLRSFWAPFTGNFPVWLPKITEFKLSKQENRRR